MNENFNKKVLSNGMILLFEKRSLPIVSMCFVVKAGGINESFEEKGISHFIEHMVFKGTKNRNVMQISSEIEKKGGVLNAFTDETLTGFHCKMPSETWKIGMNVLGDLVSNPLFNEKEIEKERQVIFEEIKMRKDNPLICTFDKIQECLFSGTLSKNLIGDEKTMHSIDRAQLVKRFEETFVPKNMILCVVGDCKFEDVVNFVEENFEKKEASVEKQDFGIKNESKEEARAGLD